MQPLRKKGKHNPQIDLWAVTVCRGALAGHYRDAAAATPPGDRRSATLSTVRARSVGNGGSRPAAVPSVSAWVEQKDPILVGENLVARTAPCVAEPDGEARLALAPPRRLPRRSPQGHHSQRKLRKLRRIANATLNDDALPPVALRIGCDDIAEQGATRRSAAIHDHDLPMACARGQLLDPRIVLEALHRDYGTVKPQAPTVVSERRDRHASGLEVLVIEVGRGLHSFSTPARGVSRGHRVRAACVLVREEGKRYCGGKDAKYAARATMSSSVSCATGACIRAADAPALAPL
jgi:hypothetical protein